MSHTPPPWRRGIPRDTIVADIDPYEEGCHRSTEDHTKHYGGFLIAESIHSRNIPIVLAAAELHEALVALNRICQRYRKGMWNHEVHDIDVADALIERIKKEEGTT